MRGLPTQYPGFHPLGCEAQYVPIMVDGNEYVLMRVRESAFDSLPYPDAMVQQLGAYMGRPVALMSDQSCRFYGPDQVMAYLSRRTVWNLPWQRIRPYHHG